MSTNTTVAKTTSYVGPFITMVLLFFVVGFLTTANTQFQVPLQEAFLSGTGDLKNTFATLITFSWFLAYPLTGGIGSKWVNRTGYRTTLIRALAVMMCGMALICGSSIAAVNFPEAALSFGNIIVPIGFIIFLLGSFVMGASVTILQVVLNPYLSACEVRGTQSIQRLAIGGASNSIGTTVAPFFVTGVVFGGLSMDAVSVDSLLLPFLAMLVIIALVAGTLSRLSLPDIQGTRAGSEEKLERSVWSFSHLKLGVIAIFFYVGAEVCIGANITMFAFERGMESPALLATLYWGGMLIGRLVGSSLSTVSPRLQLTVTTICAGVLTALAIIVDDPWMLAGVGLFHSIMWGAIFTLAVAELGKYTSAASGVFMIGVVGGAILPLLQGVIADAFGGWRFSWSIVIFCEAFMLYYALSGSKVRSKAIAIISAAIIGCGGLSSCASAHGEVDYTPAEGENVVIAYVTSWTDEMPDPQYVTHINYAFGHVNDTFDGVRIDNPERLKQIIKLREKAPELKVMLSIGGWGSGRFSEMAADSLKRAAFAADAAAKARELGLAGIDIDWEYPGSDAAGISSSENDRDNFTLLMRDLRKALGNKMLLTFADAGTPEYVDIPALLPYVNFINVMTYDMGNAPFHHSALYHREGLTNASADGAIRRHIAAGAPPSKLTLGLPFYGRGSEPYAPYANFNKIEVLPGTVEMWDSIACAPYMADAEGKLVMGFENARSAAIKCRYANELGLRGTMYWDYSGDDENNTLRRTVYENTMNKPRSKHVLVLSEGHGQHEPFTTAAMKWLRGKGAEMDFSICEINRATPISKPFLADFDCIIQLDYPPYTWSRESEEAFIEYIEQGLGGWIGFHHATLLGDFDGYPMWQWFSDFMGGVVFQNYIAPLADGTVKIENTEHPVMAGLPSDFVIPDDEWYTYNVSPRPNVTVLASVDEDSYSPASDVRMGDHPVVWVNPSKAARNVYIQMGHSPRLLDTPEFTKLFENSLLWALETPAAGE